MHALETGADGERRTLGAGTLEVAVLDANRPRRAFRRITGAALDAVLPKAEAEAESKEADKAKGEDKAEGADD